MFNFRASSQSKAFMSSHWYLLAASALVFPIKPAAATDDDDDDDDD